MKTINLIPFLFSLFFLLILPASCEKNEQIKHTKPDHTSEVRRLTIIGDDYFAKASYNNAFNAYTKVIELSDPIKNRIDYVDALISIGYIYQYQGNYIQSEATAIKILPHLKYMKKPRFAWNAYCILGFNYFKNNDAENALLYFRKALHLNTSSWRKWNILNNIGIVYMKQTQYKKAAYIFEKLTTQGYYAEKYQTKSTDRLDLMDYATMTNNLGICYYNLKNPKAIDLYKKALKIRIKIKDRENLSSSYTSFSEYYLKSNPALAKKYAKLGYKKASELNLYADQKYCLIFLVHSSEGNDLKKYSNLYIKFTDSVAAARLKQKNPFSNIKYNSKLDKDENIELKTLQVENELQLQRQKNRSYISYVIISIISLITLFFTIYKTYKGKKEKKSAVFENEMRISNKLRNELTQETQNALLFAQSEDLENSENKNQMLSNLNDIYSKTRNISRENSKVATGQNYNVTLKEMISEFKTSDINILINGLNDINWNKIDKHKKIILYRVLQEIFLNMKKHSEATLAGINFKTNENNLIVNYTDNGKGKNIDAITKSGLQIIENRISNIKGNVHFDSNTDKGFKASLIIPI